MFRTTSCALFAFVFAWPGQAFSSPRKDRSGPKIRRSEEKTRPAEEDNEEDSLNQRQEIDELQKKVRELKEKLEEKISESAVREEMDKRLEKLDSRIKDLDGKIDSGRERQEEIERARRIERDEDVSGRWRMGYENGFFWESPERRFRLLVDGFFTARYGMALVGGVSDEARVLDPYGWPDRHGFDLTNARPGMSGHLFSPKLTYLLRFEMAGSPNLTSAFLSWEPHPMIRISAGQLKVPHSYQFLRSTRVLQMDNRSAATRSFSSGYDQGVMVTFTQLGGKLFEQIGVFNGARRNLPNDNMALHYVFRIGTQPLGFMPRYEDDPERTVSPRVHLAASAGYKKAPAGDLDGDMVPDDKKIVHAGAEAAFAWKGFSASADFHFRLEDHGKAVEEECPEHYLGAGRSCKRFQRYWGVHGQAGYYIWRSMQVTGRYAFTQVFDKRYDGSEGVFDSSFHPVQQVAGLSPGSVHEAGGGISYLIYRRNVRIGLYYSAYWERDYRIADDLTGESRILHWIRIQTRLIF